MSKPIAIIALAGLFLASSLSSPAADLPPVKLVTVDVIKVLANYWKRQNSESQIQEIAKAAQDFLQKEGEALDEIKKTLDDAMEQGRNSALSEDGKKRAMADAERIYGQLQEKARQADQVKENKEREIMQRRSTDNQMFYNEIRDAVLEIAKDRGATVVLDISSRSTTGVNTIMYSDAGFDVTEEVITKLNRTMPSDFKLQK